MITRTTIFHNLLNFLSILCFFFFLNLKTTVPLSSPSWTCSSMFFFSRLRNEQPVAKSTRWSVFFSAVDNFCFCVFIYKSWFFTKDIFVVVNFMILSYHTCRSCVRKKKPRGPISIVNLAQAKKKKSHNAIRRFSKVSPIYQKQERRQERVKQESKCNWLGNESGVE